MQINVVATAVFQVPLSCLLSQLFEKSPATATCFWHDIPCWHAKNHLLTFGIWNPQKHTEPQTPETPKWRCHSWMSTGLFWNYPVFFLKFILPGFSHPKNQGPSNYRGVNDSACITQGSGISSPHQWLEIPWFINSLGPPPSSPLWCVAHVLRCPRSRVVERCHQSESPGSAGANVAPINQPRWDMWSFSGG